MASGYLPGDQVELAAFDIGQGRLARLVSLDVAEPGPRLSSRSVSGSSVGAPRSSSCRRRPAT